VPLNFTHFGGRVSADLIFANPGRFFFLFGRTKDGMMLHLYERNAAQMKFAFVNTEDQSLGKKITPIRKKWK
jgi:hypothetical protein